MELRALRLDQMLKKHRQGLATINLQFKNNNEKTQISWDVNSVLV